MTTSVVTTSAMCISVIDFCVIPISDPSDHCICDGCISDDHVSGDYVCDVYILDRYISDSYPRWQQSLHQ